MWFSGDTAVCTCLWCWWRLHIRWSTPSFLIATNGVKKSQQHFAYSSWNVLWICHRPLLHELIMALVICCFPQIWRITSNDSLVISVHVSLELIRLAYDETERLPKKVTCHNITIQIICNWIRAVRDNMVWTVRDSFALAQSLAMWRQPDANQLDANTNCERSHKINACTDSEASFTVIISCYFTSLRLLPRGRGDGTSNGVGSLAATSEGDVRSHQQCCASCLRSLTRTSPHRVRGAPRVLTIPPPHTGWTCRWCKNNNVGTHLQLSTLRQIGGK